MPDDLLDKFASKICLPSQTIAHAQKFVIMLPEKLKHTKPPTLLVAAVLYVATKETDIDVTIRKLAETLDVGVSGLSQTAALVRKSSKDRQQ
jgi:transcription initiation factor TFIIIB Brf1 subunit/transcription initiation factor TFIIB